MIKLYYNLKWKLFNFKNSVSARFQRYKRGYSDSDLYNINDWFIQTIVPMLKEWMDNGPTGYPVYNDEDMTYEKWRDILYQMYVGFNYFKIYEIDGGDKLDYEPKFLENVNEMKDWNGKTFKSGYFQGGHYMEFEDGWYKMSMDDFETKKYERALQLFAKYHGGLWD